MGQELWCTNQISRGLNINEVYKRAKAHYAVWLGFFWSEIFIK